MKNVLYYDAPAVAWEHGLPVGNGRIGAMFQGNPYEEIISLNEDTLWSGYPVDYNDPEVYDWLPKVREAVFEKRYKEAEEILNRHMTGVWNESYLPMADLRVKSIFGEQCAIADQSGSGMQSASGEQSMFGETRVSGERSADEGLSVSGNQKAVEEPNAFGEQIADDVKNQSAEWKKWEVQGSSEYKRTLDLSQALYKVSFRAGSTRHVRTAFCSYPDQVLVLRYQSDVPMKLELELGSKLKGWNEVEGEKRSGLEEVKSEKQNGLEEVKSEKRNGSEDVESTRRNGQEEVESARRHDPEEVESATQNGPEGSESVIMSWHGWAPEVVEPSYYECENPVRYASFEETRSIRFETGLKVHSTDGKVHVQENKLILSEVTDCVLLVSSANSFVRYDHKPDGEYRMRLRSILEQAAGKSYEELLSRHLEDYKELFDRVELDLGHTERENLPMGKRLKQFTALEQDPELAATAFQFGRYLTIASSREGSQPANLQGIWNQELRAPWSSNYTTNINLEMNYWPAEVTGLTECTEPLMRFIEECAQSGSRTASINYHCRGWCIHHNVDLWRKTTAVGPRTKELNVQPWSFWLAGGGWLCRHLWEHYQYTRDVEFLRKTAYPLMCECAAFYLDWMVEKDGELVTCPSTSPENMFGDQGIATGISYGSAMDMEVIRELFLNCMEAAKVLEGVEAVCQEMKGQPKESAGEKEEDIWKTVACQEMKGQSKESAGEKENGSRYGYDGMDAKTELEIMREIASALERLPLYKIGRGGQLQEWIEDYEENDPTHRHLSHLYGLYPSDLFVKQGLYAEQENGQKNSQNRAEKTVQESELKKACEITLARRGNDGVAWSRAWKISLQARLRNGEMAGEEVLRYLQLADSEDASEISYTNGGIYENLFAARPLQIDGCFGFAAGIAEMLVQDVDGEVKVLPAVPAAWKHGYVKGMRLRNGRKIDIKWDEKGVESCMRW